MWIIALIALAAAAVLALRSEYEKKRLSVSEYDFSSEKVPAAFDGCRIVFLSDLHGRAFGADSAKLIRSVRECAPDLILLGGDMITLPRSGKKAERVDADLKTLKALLEGLLNIAPVLYADGNHERRFFDDPPLYEDRKEAFLELLRECRVPFLKDGRERIERGGECITVAGLSLSDDYYKPFRKTPFSKELIAEKIGPKEDGLLILMLHSPLYLQETSAYGADLVLSGHFHGGTIRLPVLGGVMTPQYRFFDPYCKGLFTEGKTQEIVSGGLGTHSVNIRFNNLPDIVKITLHKE